jgi:release factor glutamine methyltransferase
LKAWNIQKVLNWTTSFFESKNILQPKLSAELLLASVLKVSRMQLYLDYNYVLNSNQLKKYKEYIKKRLENITYCRKRI